ncbi:glycosyltransferase [Alphaproteobacteria bacterium GH1-50]|uniref:Glycosyltransferase n=1 Tax=Kangsaoukella pontilimi TaxID=2691042 RepID=A0A7C9IHK5_9RHOB|nr:glycosyltransferase family 4 protein [Kangsaoukella pontilimi]MXQ09128.1 glycosyltransferase [Kangsaoukella pontilimi]
MKIVFVHQNCPGQFRHLAPHLARDPANEVLFITQKGKPDIPGVRKLEYAPHRTVTTGIHPYLATTEGAVLNGQAVARLGFALADKGFRPDVIIGNPGWGETLFLKDVWPDVPLITLVEFFYRGRGSDVGFDTEFDGGRDSVLRARARSAPHLLAIEAADAAYAPTEWQKAQFPAAHRPKIRVIHDGIDTDRLVPDPAARFLVPGGPELSKADEVLTYVSRNLEPYRGFHSFMRALPRVLAERPQAHVVIVGGDEVSYGGRAPDGKTWREVLLDEVGPLPERVHFTGRIPYSDYVRLLQVSSVHLYLTYPFVLSWSMLEAMSAGAFVIGSATPPVEEVIEDGRNGWLVDFFDTEAMAARISDGLARRGDMDALRVAARETVLSRYRLSDCLEAQIALIREIAGQ